jgi:hypothetical protein
VTTFRLICLKDNASEFVYVNSTDLTAQFVPAAY